MRWRDLLNSSQLISGVFRADRDSAESHAPNQNGEPTIDFQPDPKPNGELTVVISSAEFALDATIDAVPHVGQGGELKLVTPSGEFAAADTQPSIPPRPSSCKMS